MFAFLYGIGGLSCDRVQVEALCVCQCVQISIWDTGEQSNVPACHIRGNGAVCKGCISSKHLLNF